MKRKDRFSGVGGTNQQAIKQLPGVRRTEMIQVIAVDKKAMLGRDVCIASLDVGLIAQFKQPQVRADSATIVGELEEWSMQHVDCKLNVVLIVG